MELKQFVCQTLVDLVEGVLEAQTRLKVRGTVAPAQSLIRGATGGRAWVNSGPLQDVAFDVAVTVSEGGERGVGSGIKIAGVSIGGDLSTNSKNESVSRLTFSIPVALRAASETGENTSDDEQQGRDRSES